MKKLFRYFSLPVMAGVIIGLLINQQTSTTLASHQKTQPVFIEAAQTSEDKPLRQGVYSYSDAVKQAAPAVVNIYTSKIIEQNNNKNNLKKIDLIMNLYQKIYKEFKEALFNNKKYTFLKASRRSGKTHNAILWLIIQILSKTFHYFCVNSE